MEHDKYNELINEYLNLKLEINELKIKQDYVKNQLQLLMDGDEIDNVENDLAQVFTTSRNFTSVDKKKGVELFGDKFNECIKSKESSFLVIKEKTE